MSLRHTRQNQLRWLTGTPICRTDGLQFASTHRAAAVVESLAARRLL